MAVLKGYIEASGLSRLYQHLSNYHCATISACRGYTMDAYIKFRDELDKGKELQNIPEAKAYKLTASQNKVRHKDLGNRLHRDPKFTGITQINGVFQEKGSDEPSLEVSYIVFCDDYNYLWDNITAFGDTKGSPSYSEIRGRPFLWDNYEEVSYGKVEAMDFTKLKASLSVASATQRHHSIEALANKISKGADIVKLVDGIKEQKGTLLARFIINDCGL